MFTCQFPTFVPSSLCCLMRGRRSAPTGSNQNQTTRSPDCRARRKECLGIPIPQPTHSVPFSRSRISCISRFKNLAKPPVNSQKSRLIQPNKTGNKCSPLPNLRGVGWTPSYTTTLRAPPRSQHLCVPKSALRLGSSRFPKKDVARHCAGAIIRARFRKMLESGF